MQSLLTTLSALLLVILPCQAAELVWRREPPQGAVPKERAHASMHAVGGRLVVHGGHANALSHADTWEYNITTGIWSRVFTTPTPRRRNHVSWSTESEGIVVFGGQSPGTHLINDMWEFVPHEHRWVQHRIPRPPSRRDGTSFTTTGNVLWVFGGRGVEGVLSDLWRFSNGTWREVAAAGGGLWPPGRTGGTAGYDSTSDTVYMLGGSLGDGSHDPNLWAFHPSNESWSVVGPAADPARREGAVAVVADQTLVVVSGWNSAQQAYLGDIHAFSIRQRAWSQVNSSAIPPRSGATAALRGNTVWLFGGAGDKVHNDLYKLSVGSWAVEQVHPDHAVPLPRAFFSAVAYNGMIVVFGGKSGVDVQREDITGFSCPSAPLVFNDLWTFAEQSGKWSLLDLPGAPDRRHSHSAVLYLNEMVVFGGRGLDSALDDLWVLRLDVSSWQKPPVSDPHPHPRFGHAAAVKGGVMYMMGGSTSEGWLLDDLWIIDLTTWQWTEVRTTAPLPYLKTFVLLPFPGGLYALGGSGEAGEPNPWVYRLNASSSSITRSDTPLADGGLANVAALVVSENPFRALVAGADQHGFIIPFKSMAWVWSEGGVTVLNSTMLYPPEFGRSGGKMVMIGNRLMLVGGFGPPPGGMKTESFVLNDVWSAELPRCATDLLCFECPPTTYSNTTQGCVLCPPGTYSSQFGAMACTPCPPGTFSTSWGLRTRSACEPCPAGTYQDTPGSTACTPCSNTSFCPLRATTPYPSSYAVETSSLSDIDVQHPTGIDVDRSSVQVLIYWILIGFAAATIIVVIVFLASNMAKGSPGSENAPYGADQQVQSNVGFARFDWLFGSEHRCIDGTFRRQVSSPHGGLATIIAVLCTVCVAVVLVVDPLMSKDIEVKMLTPFAFTPNPKSSFRANLDFELAFLDFKAPCGNGTCHPSINATVNGFLHDKWSLACREDRTRPPMPVCVVRWVCSGCRFQPNEGLQYARHGSVLISSTHEAAEAFALLWRAASTSGYPGEESRLSQGRIAPSEPGRVFKGSRPPTEILLEATLTEWEEPVSDSYQTGMHLLFSDHTQGSVGSMENVTTLSGLAVRIDVKRSEELLTVRRENRENPVFLFSVLLGIAPGVMVLGICFVHFGERAAFKHGIYPPLYAKLEDRDEDDERPELSRLRERRRTARTRSMTSMHESMPSARSEVSHRKPALTPPTPATPTAG